MCKILVQEHACGHDAVLRKDACFLVRNKFECMNEEKQRVKRSGHNCRNCRRNQRNARAPKVVSLPSQRVETSSQRHDSAKPSSQNPATIISNLKALRAQVAAGERITAISKAQRTKPDQAKAEDSGTKPSLVSNERQTRLASEGTAGRGGRGLVDQKPLTTEIAFSQFMDEMDDLSGKSKATTKSGDPSIRRCHGRDPNSTTGKQLWTPDARESARFPDTELQKRCIQDLDSDQSVRRTEYVSSLSPRKTRTKVENGTTAVSSKSRVEIHLARSKVRRRRSSKVSTASARSAKRKIDIMLNLEFEQTAHLGDIILASPETSPLPLETGGDYDPAQSYLALVKAGGK